jgi:hypothetical protein
MHQTLNFKSHFILLSLLEVVQFCFYKSRLIAIQYCAIKVNKIGNVRISLTSKRLRVTIVAVEKQ